MARVLYSAEINELKGSIGGTTFQRNKSGTIAKLKSSLVFNPTSKQLSSQGVFNFFVGSWQNLSLADKNLWNDFAAANQKFNYWNLSKELSGFNWYLSLNVNRYLTGQAVLTSPPVYVTPLFCPEFRLFPLTDSLSIMFDSFPEKDNYYLFVYATPPIRSVNLQSRKSLRLIAVIDPTPVLWHDLTADWELFFQMDWPPSDVDGGFQILTAISCVDKNTGIAGQFWLDNRALDLNLDPGLFGSSAVDLGQQFAQLQIQAMGYVGAGVVLAGAYNSALVLRSTDFGQSYSNLGAQTADQGVYSFCFCGSGICLMGSGNTGHVIRSTDYGVTWSDLGQMFAQTFVYALEYCGNGIVLAGTAPNARILRSTDYGATWFDLGTFGGGNNFRCFKHLGSGIVLAGGGIVGHILRSTDYGATWSDLGQQFGLAHIFNFADCDNGIVIASTGNTGHILRSTDYGATWSDLGAFFGTASIKEVDYLGFGVIICGSGASGKLLRSTDYGVTWFDLGQQGGETAIISFSVNGFTGISFGSQALGHCFYELF
jgi:photosystem II stability/assembly factor-like uncharacterized protein